MGAPNPVSFPKSVTLGKYLKEAQRWLDDAVDYYDPQFTDPTLAVIARVRSYLMASVKLIDDITWDDTVELDATVHRDAPEEGKVEEPSTQEVVK